MPSTTVKVPEWFMRQFTSYSPFLTTVNDGVLNYWDFNILVEKVRDQDTVLKNISGDFFERLSEHKHKMYFVGQLDRKKKLFTLIEVIYMVPYGVMGIYVKKNIIKSFKDANIVLVPLQKLNSKESTVTRMRFSC